MSSPIYLQVCSVCQREFSRSNDWLNHLAEEDHQQLARIECIDKWDSELRKCCLIVYTSERLTNSTSGEIVNYFSKKINGAMVTDFVWWEDRPHVVILQFESSLSSVKDNIKMEDWQRQHISSAQLSLGKIIASKTWLVLEIENKAGLTNEESKDLASYGSSYEKTNYLIEILKNRHQGYKILLSTLLQNLFNEGLQVLQDAFSPTILQDMQIDISGREVPLSNIFSPIHIENICKQIKTKVRVTDFTRLLLKLTGERALLLCVEDSGTDNEEEIQIKIEMTSVLLTLDSNLIHKKDSYGRTPLLAKHCHLDLIKYLVEEGSDIYLTDDDGYTLVHVAAGWMSPDTFHELVKFLLMDCKASELFKWKENMGNTSLHFALSYLSEIRADTIQLILEETKINVNDTNRYGETLLYRAFLGGQNAEILKVLLNYGADYMTKKENRLNDFGGWGNAEAFLYLLRLGIDVLE